MLRVKDVTKSFAVQRPAWRSLLHRPARRTVLEAVSFDAVSGSVVGVLGANGAGKSTLLQIVAGLVKPDRGRVFVDGTVALCGSADRSFYYRLTLRENLRFFGALVGLRGATLQRRLDEVLHQNDLQSVADRLYSRCSSGMRQRANIARALLSDPQLLALDEPTRAVDPVHAQALRRYVRETLVKERGKTVLLATNVVEEAWELCDRVALLDGGRIVAFGTLQELAHRGTHPRYRIAFDRMDDALLERVRAAYAQVIDLDREAHVLRVELDRNDPARLTMLLRAVTANGVRVRSISEEMPSPEDLFLNREKRI
ncbi:MAG: ATP-binding cassette domain-containing protein [Vulcanimicrobiaceae bacterium]